MKSLAFAVRLTLMLPLAASAEDRRGRVPGDRSWTRNRSQVEARESLEFPPVPH